MKTTLSLIAQKSNHAGGMIRISMNEVGTKLTETAMQGEYVGVSVTVIHSQIFCMPISNKIILCHENSL